MSSPRPETVKAVSRSLTDAVSRWQKKARAWFRAEFEEAQLYYIRSRAEKGDPYNEYRLGLLYESGQFGKRSDAEAYKWFLRAAFQGIAEAQAKVSEFHRYGRGVMKNSEEAFKWCRKAAEQGHILSQVRLAEMYRDGIGVPRNPSEAKKWYHKAASKSPVVEPMTETASTGETTAARPSQTTVPTQPTAAGK